VGGSPAAAAAAKFTPAGPDWLLLLLLALETKSTLLLQANCGGLAGSSTDSSGLRDCCIFRMLS
jgi:hypothetical protein